MAEPGSSEPLLSSSDSSASYSTIDESPSDVSLATHDAEQFKIHDAVDSRSLEDEVLPQTSRLGRNLGWGSCYVLIMSRVIGSGIFATPGVIVRDVGSVGLSLLLWAAGALFAWFGLAITLEYGCMLPRSGGDKVYLEFTYRRPRFLATTLIAFQSVLLGFTASNCIVFATYVCFALGIEATLWKAKLLAAGLLFSVCFVHSCFLKTGIWIQNFLGWIKIALLMVMVLTSLFAVFYRPSELSGITTDQVSNSGIWEGSIWNWGIVSTAFFKVWYSYNGLQNVNTVLDEVKDPIRTLKSAASAALFSACVLYLLVNIAYFLVVPLNEIKQSEELIAGLFFARVFGNQVGQVVLPLAVAISAAGNVFVTTFSHARMIQEIAREGFLPYSDFVSSTKPFNAPMGALIVHFIPSFLVITIPSGHVYSLILNIEGFPAQFFAIAIALGLIWLRFKRRDLYRPYKAWLSVVYIRIALSAALIAAPFVPRYGLTWREHLTEVSYAFVGTAVMLLAVIYWYIRIILLPRWKGYYLEERTKTLDDGTSVSDLVKVPTSKDTHAGR